MKVGLPKRSKRSPAFQKAGLPDARSGTIILHAVRNDAVDFLAIVPSPPPLIFKFYTFPTGERARVRGKNQLFSGSSY